MPFAPAVAPMQDPFSGLGRGMENFAQSFERQQRRQKADAGLAKSYKAALVARGIATKEQAETLSLQDAQAAVFAAEVKDQMERQAVMRAQEARAAQRAALDQEMDRLNLNVAKKAESGKNMFREWMGSQANKPPQDVAMQAGFNSGWAGADPRGFSQAMQMLYPETTNERPVQEVGTLKPLPNMPDFGVFNSSTKSSELVRIPGAAGAPQPAAVPVMVNGQPSGYLQMPNNTVVKDPRLETGASDPALREGARVRLAKAQATLDQLKKMKEDKVTSARIDRNTGAVLAPSFLANDEPIDDLIRQQEALIVQAKDQAGTAAGAITVDRLMADDRVLKILEQVGKGLSREEARAQIEALFK